MKIQTKRAYEDAEKNDGYRVLVDRIWPRGVKKEDAKIDLWKKDVAPSTELRKWFGHDSEKWDDFQKKYKKELEKNSEWKNFQEEISGKKMLTLVYSAKDTEHNQAVVLKNLLDK